MKAANVWDLEMTLWKKYFLVLDESFHKSCDEIEVVANLSQLENKTMKYYSAVFPMEQVMTPASTLQCWFFTK